MTMLGKHHSQETKDKISKSRTGILGTDACKQKHSEIATKLWRDPAYVEKMKARPHAVLTSVSRASMGKASEERWKDPQWRLGQVTKLKEVCGTEEFRVKMRDIALELWKNPEHARKTLHRRTPSGVESIFIRLLEDNDFKYRYIGNGEIVFGGKNPDFININGQKKLIEIWGNHWHQGQNPQERIDYFKKFGFDTLVIWASELRYPEQVIDKIQKFDTL